MKRTITSPYYLKIARDIAARIANDEFKEGHRIYGRSTMASEYGTSPETIRRALKLLADMKVVEVKPQSGATVLSKDNAARYISSFEETNNLRAMTQQLHALKEQYDDLNTRIIGTVEAIIQSRYSYSAANEPLPNYEISVPAGSPLIGKSIGALKFWQATGTTIVAIRRGQNVILSPGPYAELYDGDTLILVGTPAAVKAASRLVSEGGTA